jgi:hypothetical protein
MLDYAIWKSQCNMISTTFTTPKFQMQPDNHPVPVALTELYDHSYFIWDNAATFSICTNATANLLTGYVATPDSTEDLSGFSGGPRVSPIGYGYLPNFPIKNLRIYHVPQSQTNIIGLNHICHLGGSYACERSLRVYNSEHHCISNTTPQPNGMHIVPMELIINTDLNPSSGNILSSPTTKHLASLDALKPDSSSPPSNAKTCKTATGKLLRSDALLAVQNSCSHKPKRNQHFKVKDNPAFSKYL